MVTVMRMSFYGEGEDDDERMMMSFVFREVVGDSRDQSASGVSLFHCLTVREDQRSILLENAICAYSVELAGRELWCL